MQFRIRNSKGDFRVGCYVWCLGVFPGYVDFEGCKAPKALCLDAADWP